MSVKRRRAFTIENSDGEVLGKGVLYDQGNIQVLWLKDRGWTGVQYKDISYAIGILPGATVIRVEEV